MELQFEDILKQVGDFGCYQKTLVCIFLLPAVIVIPWFMLGTIFLSSVPDHWCDVPDIDKFNLTIEEKQQLLRPKVDRFCSEYDVNFTAVLSHGNWTQNMDEWPTKSCSNGWIYDDTDFYSTASTRWDLVCENEYYSSMIISMVFVGNMFGAMLLGSLPDRIGRKTTFLFLAFVIGITEISSVFVPDFTVFLILRTINGSCGSLLYIVSYVILLEIVGADLRTRMNGFSTGAWSIGLCLLPLCAWLTRSWINLSIVISSAAFIMLIHWKILPESPRWFLSQGRYEEAFDVLCEISKRNGKKAHESSEFFEQLKKIGEQMKKEKEDQAKYTHMDLLKHPQLRKKFLLLTFCWISDAVSYYGLQINVKNLIGSQFLNFFLLSVVEFPSHGIAWFIMERTGRRWCTVGAFAVASISCLLPVLTFSDNNIIEIVASILGKLGSSAAFMSLYQQAPELYPTPLRGLGMSLSASIGTAFSLTAPYISDMACYGKHTPFLIFGALDLAASIASSFLPETLHRELPQTIADSEKFGANDKFLSCCRRKKVTLPSRNSVHIFNNLSFTKESIFPTVEMCENKYYSNPSFVYKISDVVSNPNSSENGVKNPVFAITK